MVRRMLRQAAELEDGEQRKRAGKWAVQSQAAARVDAMLRLAESEPEIACRFSEFDPDPLLLNVENGTIDLRTGDLRPHRREDLITHLAPVRYDADARAPQWEAFLRRVLNDDADLIAFLKRAAGYALSGSVREQVWFFLYGMGANGKSTFLRTLLDMVGSYGRQAAPELLVSRRGEYHPTELATLAGVRLAVCSEVGPDRSLDIVKVKQMTGGDRMTARYIRQDFFEFDPSFKIFLAANHKPSVKDTTDSTWRRIRLIPFVVQIPPEEQDEGLLEKFREEWSGILNWCLEGALSWQEHGLAAPGHVLAATEAYRGEQDIIGGFLESCCVFGPESEFMASAKDLYEAYKSWCEETGEEPVRQRTFGTRLAERGLARRKHGKGRRYHWFGVGLARDEGFAGSAKTGEPREEQRDLYDGDGRRTL